VALILDGRLSGANTLSTALISAKIAPRCASCVRQVYTPDCYFIANK